MDEKEARVARWLYSKAHGRLYRVTGYIKKRKVFVCKSNISSGEFETSVSHAEREGYAPLTHKPRGQK